MERNLQKNGLINLFLLLIAGVAVLTVSRYSHLHSGEVASVFLGAGVLIAAVGWFQMRLAEQERLERLEFDELTKGGTGSALFRTQEEDAFPARRSRLLFEKYFVRGFALLLCLGELGAAWWFWRLLRGAALQPLEQPLLAMALLAMFGLVLFLMGKYASGLAQMENQRLLKPSSSFLLLGAYLLGLKVVAIIAVWAGIERFDYYLAHAFCILLGLLGVELAFALILDFYRPRIQGQVGLPLYESRLVGLLSHPEGLVTTAAQALDYQFGFKVSETWFYRFLQRAMVWIILGQLVLLTVSSCVVFIDVGEEGLLERWGRPVSGRSVLEPGLHVKLPWPVDRVRRFPSKSLQSFSVGFEHEEGGHERDTMLWTVAHYAEEYHLLVASRGSSSATNRPAGAGQNNPPVNLVSLGMPVQYWIEDLESWAYNHVDAAALLRDLATREVVYYLASADMNELMTTGRFEAGNALKALIQARADEFSLGVRIAFVGLQDIHPPVHVAPAYERVVSARREREAEILAAQAFAVKTNVLSRALTGRLVSEALAEQHRLRVTAQARAARFTNQLSAYLASPSVFAQRAYLEALREGGANARKTILATTNTEEVITLNLEERLRSEFYDIPLASPGEN